MHDKQYSKNFLCKCSSFFALHICVYRISHDYTVLPTPFEFPSITHSTSKDKRVLGACLDIRIKLHAAGYHSILEGACFEV